MPAKRAKAQIKMSLYQDATFLLPVGTKVSARWVLPPAGVGKSGAMFSVDPDGHPVIAYESDGLTYFLNPMKEYIVAVATKDKVSAVTHLPNGLMLLAAGKDIGLLAEPSKKMSDKKGVPIVGFQPVVSLPVTKIDVLAAAGNEVYAAGLNPRTGRYSIYYLHVAKGAGPMDIELVHESDKAVTAVAANDNAIFVAAGNKVSRINRKDGSVTLLYTAPSSTVTGLALTPAGIIASTAKELVLIADGGTFEMMRSSGHQIAMRGDTLYVLFNSSMGVAAIGNLADLERFNLAVSPAAPTSLSIKGVRFFESGPPPYADRNFAENFDRKSVRTIVAQIDYSSLPGVKGATWHTITVSWYAPTGDILKSSSYPVLSRRGARVGRLLASIGGEPGGKYLPPQDRNRKGGIAYSFGDDDLGLRYPGRYRVLVQVDGAPAGEGFFTLTGQAKPEETLVYDDMGALRSMLDNGLSARQINDLLETAIIYGSPRSVELLLKRKADPNARNNKGKLPLELCPQGPDPVEKAELLIKYGANVNAKSSDGDLLVFNIDFFAPELVAELINNGADIYAKNKLGETVTEWIVEDPVLNHRGDVVSALLKRGADLNRVFGKAMHYNLLGRAIRNSDYDLVDLLLKKGVSTYVVHNDPPFERDRSALYVALDTFDKAQSGAAREKSRKIVCLLLSKGATLRLGKRIATSTYYGTTDYAGLYSDIRSGEGGMMFKGGNEQFFSKADLLQALDQDDTALEEASKSSDPAIQKLALSAHLARILEMVSLASNSDELSYAGDECKATFKLAEARYKPMQVDVVPEAQMPAQGGRSKAFIGVELVKREAGGAYVQGVIPGKSGNRAGLKAGDIILALDTQKMKDAAEIISAVSSSTPGIPVRVTFLRDQPMLMPDLPLACGLVEKELGKNGLAEMNLSRWLAANPDANNAADVRAVLKDVYDKEKQKATAGNIRSWTFKGTTSR
ncbi:MAG: PDZ domain-containing protein [Nitrospiraceae bacterium]|nr:PDZ domain-containing protein [Nitrospiraceae bacterium]